MDLREIYRSILHLVGLFSSIVSFSLIALAVVRHCFPLLDSITRLSALSNYYSGKTNDSIFNSSPLASVFVQAASNECNLSKHWKSHFTSDAKSSKLQSFTTNIPIWGSFRPEIFFGMKSRSGKHPTVTGIAWNSVLRSSIRHKTEDISNFYWSRHNGRSFGDEVVIDGANNVQINASFLLSDSAASTSKFQNKNEVGKSDPSALVRPSWIQKIAVSSIVQNMNEEKSLFFYIGNEISHKQSASGAKSSDFVSFNYFYEQLSSSNRILHFGGRSELSGNFIIQIQGYNSGTTEFCENQESCNRDDLLMRLTYHASATIDATSAMDTLVSEINRMSFRSSQKFTFINADGDLSNDISPSSSFVLVKVTSANSFTLKISLFEHLSYKGKHDFEKVAVSLVDETGNEELFQNERLIFDENFEDTFKLRRQHFTEDQIQHAKIALSSLLGGIGYFQGSPEIGDGTDLAKPTEDTSTSIPDAASSSISQGDPISLLSCTPSRTVFPRGFLWDEGFHQLLVSAWDPELSLFMLRHWFLAIYQYSGPDPSSCAGGWIPREMILGDVSRSRVPSEFITQRVNIANPPTLLLALESITSHCNRLRNDLETMDEQQQVLRKQQLKGYTDALSDLYPFVEKWVIWFLSSQKSSNSEMVNTFRWRGRSSDDKKQIPNTLASGLDDYPRSVIASAEEAHVDLMAWIVMSCKVMGKLGEFLQQDVSFFKAKEKLYFQALNRWHWSVGSAETDSSREFPPGYYDIGLDHKMNRYDQFSIFRCINETDKAMVDVQVPLTYLQSGQKFCPESHPKPLYPHRDDRGRSLVFETLLLVPKEDLKRQHLPRVGYVNIFPFILQLIPVDDEARISAAIDIIENPDYLWTEYGLRSIAKSDMFYMKRNAEGDAPYWR
jgi:mannosyl-oligosaccharide glucosidase